MHLFILKFTGYNLRSMTHIRKALAIDLLYNQRGSMYHLQFIAYRQRSISFHLPTYNQLLAI